VTRLRIICGIGVFLLAVGVVPPAVAQTTLSYGMDETSGTSMLGTGGAPPGTISGDVTLGVPGNTGSAGDGAYAFNQNAGNCDSSSNVTGTGFVKISSKPVFAVGSLPFSFSVWVNTTTVPGKDSGATAKCDFDVVRRSSQWKLELIPTGNVSNRRGVPHCVWTGVLNGTPTKAALTGASSVTDGSWHQITCSRTDTGEQLIVDGAIVATSATNLGEINSTSKIFIGKTASGEDFYQGLLDDFSFVVG